jgi:predicted ATPase
VTTPPEIHIRTPDQRLRVFVSSALGELADERLAVRRAIEALRLTPVMFEMGARPYPPRALYRAYLEQSHVFLGIYWQSYGWVAPDEEVSGLEDEYRLSGEHPRLVYIRRPAAERQERLDLLLRLIEADDQASYRQFSSSDELERLVQDDLMVLLTERFEAVKSPSPAPRLTVTEPPVPLTPILGRDAEIDEIRRLLGDGCRVLTLLGPGGVGKSRLALEACRSSSLTAFDSVAFVPLETVDDPSDVMRVVARSIGATIEGAHGPLDVVIQSLAGQRMLLLVDNFEQVAEAGAELTRLLEACPGVSAVVTSRRPLRVRGEHQFMVEPLALPHLLSATKSTDTDPAAASESPAVALFVERAQRVSPGFVLDAGNVDTVAALVHRLDGLPLAIELAAARVKMLEPRQMLERLESGIEVSMSAGADVPERQRTLRATLKWSCALLTPAQQTLLARLSVFADGATLEAIESVCSGVPVVDVLDDLSALLDNGLVRADRERIDGQPRFALLLTVREFAGEQLSSSGEAAAVTTRFLDWALETATLGDPVQHRDAPGRWPELLVEAGNLRKATQLLLEEGNWQGFTTMAWGTFHWIFRFGNMRVFAAWAERALAQAGEPQTEADRATAARLYSGVAWARFLLGDVTGALAAQESVDIEAVVASDPACAALLLNTRALAVPLSDGGAEAREVAERCLVLAESTRFDAVSAYTHAFLANLDLINSDLPSAEGHCRRCVVIASDIGLSALAGQQNGILGLVEIAQGRIAEGRIHFAAALEAARIEGSLHDAAVLLAHLAVLAAVEGRAGDAVRLRGVADEAMARLGLGHWPMLEEARAAVMGGRSFDRDVALSPDAHQADPWAELARELRVSDVAGEQAP